MIRIRIRYGVDLDAIADWLGSFPRHIVGWSQMTRG